MFNFLKAKTYKLKATSGFTLIELLVVIAIIGILSGIVLTSLGTARNKAKMASAQASMSSMRSEAELAVDSSGKYPGTLCNQVAAGGGIGTLLSAPLTTLEAAVFANSGSHPSCTESVIEAATLDSWATWVDVDPGTGTTLFCVDSSGAAKDIGGALAAGDTTCS